MVSAEYQKQQGNLQPFKMKLLLLILSFVVATMAGLDGSRVSKYKVIRNPNKKYWFRKTGTIRMRKKNEKERKIKKTKEKKKKKIN